MMSEIASQNIHQHLIETLDNSQARYRIVEHEASGKCEAVSEIRGTALGQGAKALVCKIKGNGVKMHVLAILAADLQADLARLASFFGGSKASLANPAGLLEKSIILNTKDYLRIARPELVNFHREG